MNPWCVNREISHDKASILFYNNDQEHCRIEDKGSIWSTIFRKYRNFSQTSMPEV
jgi:hypothetical protein